MRVALAEAEWTARQCVRTVVGRARNQQCPAARQRGGGATGATVDVTRHAKLELVRQLAG
jgi:hypothetical protein